MLPKEQPISTNNEIQRERDNISTNPFISKIYPYLLMIINQLDENISISVSMFTLLDREIRFSTLRERYCSFGLFQAWLSNSEGLIRAYIRHSIIVHCLAISASVDWTIKASGENPPSGTYQLIQCYIFGVLSFGEKEGWSLLMYLELDEGIDVESHSSGLLSLRHFLAQIVS